MIIGIDFGNINFFSAYISGIDERTHRGGVDHFLLPNDYIYRGNPSAFHFRKGRKPGEQDIFSYGNAASIAVPIANRRETLKRKLSTSEVIDGRSINYDDVIIGMLKHIVEIANDVLVKEGNPRCNKIALAYPVVYKLHQKEHLKELAEQVILSDGKKVQVVGMIQEPAAAALEYLSTLPVAKTARDYTVLVYDLGGGTFDAAIVTAHQDANGVMTNYRVMEQDGLPRAGNEFTDAMVNLLERKLRALDAKIATNDAAKTRFRKEAENLKCTLSEPGTTRVEYEDDDGNSVEVTRKELEDETEALVSETIATARKVYDRSTIKPDMVIMTGGQSQMPIIRTRLQEEFASIGKDNIIFHKPQQAIALGAARFGVLNCESDDVKEVVVSLLTSRMLGTPNTRDKPSDRRYVDVMIPRNTPIPMDKPITKIYAPSNKCKQMDVYLAEAKNDNPDIYNDDDFVKIAKLTIDFNIVIPAQPDFELSVYIDKSNTIHFSAHDPKGKFKTVSVEVEYLNGNGG